MFARRQKQIPQPGRAGFWLQLLDHRDHLPLVRTLAVFPILRFVGVDVLLHEGRHAPLELLHFTGEVKYHRMPREPGLSIRAKLRPSEVRNGVEGIETQLAVTEPQY